MTQSELCQIAVAALAASARLLVGGSEDMPLSPNSSDDEGAVPRPPQQITSPTKPAMPAGYSSAASLVQSVDETQWRVRMGEDVPKFIYANGPGRIVCYNFKTTS